MKNYTLFLIFLFTISQTQSQSPSPIPLPSLNLTNVEGFWYVTAIFESVFNKSIANYISCFFVDISVNNTLILTNQTIYYNQVPIHSSMGYQTMNLTSIWVSTLDGNSVVEWIAADIVGYTWGLIGSADSQYAIFLSRTPNISSLLMKGLIYILLQENYLVNDINILTINNTCNDVF